jgi:hypothetical protein
VARATEHEESVPEDLPLDAAEDLTLDATEDLTLDATEDLPLDAAGEDDAAEAEERERINRLLETVSLGPEEPDELDEAAGFADICPIPEAEPSPIDPVRAQVIRTSPGDDRDLIRVVDPEDLGHDREPSAEPSGSDYRRLFSRLREGL